MRKLNLQTKVFLAYLAMSILIITTFATIFYHYTSQILVERETKSVITLNEGFLTQTDDVIRDMDNVSINISYSNMVKEHLYEDINIKVGSDDFKSLANLFVAINGADLTVDQINLYDFSGNVLQVGVKTNSSSIDLEAQEWISAVRENSGKKTLSDPYATTALISPGASSKIPAWYISLYRTFNNEYKKQIGIIETTKKCSSIFKQISAYQKKNADAAAVYIYNEQGDLIYPYKLEAQERNDIPDYFNARNLTVSSQIYQNPERNIHEIMTYETSSYTHWTYITVLPETYVLKPVQEFSKLLVGVIFCMLILCAFISYQFSRGLTKPLKQLQRIIRKTALENLGQGEPQSLNTSFDELEALNQEFTKMSAKLKTSMDNLIESKQQEFKSRNLALQSQINPHFYYNTLASIIVLAENGQAEQVAVMCRNLTKMMRYITDGSSESVALDAELDYLRQYLYCMKVRYQSSLTYEINIDERILNERVPKLVIQPLVENALKYSTICSPPWHIRIESKISADHWQIDIIDSGNGFDENSILLIDKRIKDASESLGMPDIQIDGMGMLNVYLRWKFFCKDDIIFAYGNTSDGHGIVSLGRKSTSYSTTKQE